MSRHAEPRSDDELAEAAATMPPIDEQRVDGWDDKPWMEPADQVDAVEDVPRYTAVRVQWRDAAGRPRVTRVGDQGGREAEVHSDAHTTDLAVVAGHQFLEVAAGG